MSSIPNRIAIEKKNILELLKKYPIVQLACEKSGVSRATFYRWKEIDEKFRDDADTALFEWKQLVNDIAEMNVITWIKNEDKSYTTFWLKNNHGSYKNTIMLSKESESEWKNKKYLSLVEFLMDKNNNNKNCYIALK